MIPDYGRLGQHSDQVTAVCGPIRSTGKIVFLLCRPAELPIISPRQWVRNVKLALAAPRRHGGGVEVWLYSFLPSGLKGVVNITLRLLCLCEELENALNSRLGGLQSGSKLFTKKEVLCSSHKLKLGSSYPHSSHYTD
jgi:hypothetical protein